MKQKTGIFILFLSFLSACQKDIATITANKTDVQPTQSKSVSASLTPDAIPAGGTFYPSPSSGGGDAEALIYDPENGFVDYPLVWNGDYTQRGIIIVMKTGVRITTLGGNIVWQPSPLYLSQVTITGGAVGTVTSHANFQVEGWTPGTTNPYYATAVEQRTIVYTSNGAATFAAGMPAQYPIGATFSNGYTITQTVSSVTDYDLNYLIQFYVDDPNGQEGNSIEFSYTDNGSAITGVPSN